MSEDEHKFVEAMRFLDQSECFSRGYECGVLDGRMRAGDMIDAQPVNPKNKDQIAMIARKNDYEIKWEESPVPDWAFLTAWPSGLVEPLPADA